MKGHSVRRFIGWWRKRLDLLVERVAKLFGNVIIKTKTGNDSGFGPQIAVWTNPGSGGGQAYNVLTSPITARGNAIDDSLPAFCQVNKDCLFIAVQSQAPTLLFCGDDGIVHSLFPGVES